MKTKIVYVLVSDTSDYYYEQTLLSVSSARMWNPDAEIIVVADDKTNATLVGSRTALMDVADKKIVVSFPEEINKKRRSRFLKTSIRNHVEGDFLFIDSDTVICQSLEEVDSLTIEMGAVLDGHRKLQNRQDALNQKKEKIEMIGASFVENAAYYNSGVLYVKDTPQTHAFFEKWYAIYTDGLRKGMDFDQPSLHLCNQKFDLIKPLDGEYNCQIFLGGLPYLGYAKIIHAFNGYRDYSNFFIFNDPHYLGTIKSQGELYDADLNRLKNAKKQFQGEYVLAFGSQIEYNKSVLFHLFVDNRRFFHWVEFIGKVLLKIHRSFNRKK